MTITINLKSLRDKEEGQDMCYAGFLSALLIRGRSWRCVRAFTLIELMIMVAIAGTLAAVGVPTYNGYIDKARSTTSAVDIREVEQRISTFRAERGRMPATLAEVGFPNLRDPWGRPYQYLDLEGVDKKDLKGQWRRDRFLNPLNTDYDLYSVGKDGQTVPALTAKDSHDDIVRANNGRFVGLATDY